MIIKSKRIQFIHRTKDGRCDKVWQRIDTNRMITLEDLWKNLKDQWIVSMESTINWKFFSENTQRYLPTWFHVDLLNDQDHISIEEMIDEKNIVPHCPFVELSTSSNRVNVAKTSLDMTSVKIISKQKQLKSSITNRSFVITDKHFIPNDFYQQWKEGLMNIQTKTCRFIY